MILSFIVALFVANDATTATLDYRGLDLEHSLNFLIERKYNNAERPVFPNFCFYGQLIEKRQPVEIKVSKGNFNKYAISDTITVFKGKGNDMIMTQYEINNQKFIKLFGQVVSSMFILAFVFFFLGVYLIYKIKKQTR